MNEENVAEEQRKLDELSFETPIEEEKDEEITSSEIYTDKSDPEVESLHKRYQRGDLDIQPDFQRYSVWDNGKKSRLIESAILNIPLPVLYFSERKDGVEEVIDGQQRLNAFFEFLENEFKLRGIKVFKELEGKRFNQLPREVQKNILTTSIHTITFKKRSDESLKFEIFERLNTGSVSLNDQELRNCIYRGPYNELLKNLAKNPDFMFLLGLDAPDKRMKDVELVLRFAAFYHYTYLNYKPPMKGFLNKDMQDHQHLSEKEGKELEEAFKKAVSTIRSLFGKHAFKRFYPGDENNKNGRWEVKKFNASLYDILMYTLARAEKNKVFQHLDSIREALIHLMTSDKEFIDSILISTSDKKAVKTRFDKWRKTLEEITEIEEKEPRCFSLELKKELYEENPTCKRCGQKIQDIDDAAVDHIEQYWKGGKTIPENARLLHRYCNQERPKNE